MYAIYGFGLQTGSLASRVAHEAWVGLLLCGTGTMTRGSSHSRQWRLTVSSSFMPIIWKAPAPIVHTTGRPGWANLAETAYGIEASIEASDPERLPSMPRPSLMCCP